MAVSTSLQSTGWSPTIAATRSIGRTGGRERAAVAGVCPPAAMGESATATINRLITADRTPRQERGSVISLRPGETRMRVAAPPMGELGLAALQLAAAARGAPEP